MLTAAGYVVAFTVIILLFYVSIRSMIRMSRRNTSIQQHAAQLMEGRSALSDGEFASRYFPADQTVIASRVRGMLADILIVDGSRIHPDDKLIEDLGFGRVDGLDPDFLELDVKKSFGVDLRPAWRPELTIRELVEHISKHITSPVT